ncbi:PP2C family protein-serine/threonine phosphatase [uncultured Methanobrevibacter sp.]|uniref:PP2C family protein-serine/threonine phosphatase n=1 Tax=uncultured Methanobrevibacter sp. TaxID=253161 RepID=UPI0025E2D394|nr:PP2C family protein-serine/threonine phosphatase [uncultured Methanobrevibacter sp.]
MVNVRNLLLSKKFILLFSILMEFITMVFAFIVLGGFEFAADIFVIPILCVIWGPFAALGCAISQICIGIIFDSVHWYYYLFDSVILFIAGTLVWKLWYSCLSRFGFDIPNLGNYASFIKIFVVYACFYAAIRITGFLPIEYGLFFDFETSFPISMLLMMGVIYIINYFKIPVYTPQKQFRSILPEKVFSIMWIFLTVSGIIVFITFDDMNLMLFIIPVAIIYLFRPYESSVFKLKRVININLIQKMTFSVFLIFFMIEVMMAGSYIFNNYQMILELIKNGGMYYQIFKFSNDIFTFLILFVVPFLFYLYFLEKNVTNPLNKISNSLNFDTGKGDENLKIKENLESISLDNEIKFLADSLIKMEGDVAKYREKLLEVTAENERYETELYLADSIQSSMIPTDYDKFCENKNFEIWGFVEAAHEVGGDFYDYFQIDDENIGFVIGDVSGKGVSAALVMVEAMTLIQDYAKHYEDLSECFSEVNNLIYERNDENHFVTSLLGKLNLKTGKLHLVNAGHNPPLLKQNNSFEYLNIDSGLVLGIMEDVDYKVHSIKLSPDDELFLYTDGITEANTEYNGFYGEDRLKEILNKHSSDNLDVIISSVKEDIDRYCDYQEQFDDMTMLIVKFK